MIKEKLKEKGEKTKGTVRHYEARLLASFTLGRKSFYSWAFEGVEDRPRIVHVYEHWKEGNRVGRLSCHGREGVRQNDKGVLFDRKGSPGGE